MSTISEVRVIEIFNMMWKEKIEEFIKRIEELEKTKCRSVTNIRMGG